MPSVLFVCTANRFRSPLAECFFKAQLQSRNLTDWIVSSAGTWTKSGLPAMDSAVKIAFDYGLDVSSHQSSLIDINTVQANQLILVMESGQKEALSIEYPSCKDRVYLLSEAVSQKTFEIPDPFSKNESPHLIGNELYSLIRDGAQSIISLAIRMELD